MKMHLITCWKIKTCSLKKKESEKKKGKKIEKKEKKEETQKSKRNEIEKEKKKKKEKEGREMSFTGKGMIGILFTDHSFSPNFEKKPGLPNLLEEEYVWLPKEV